MDTQQIRGAALVALAMIEHFDEERDFDFAHHDFVQVVGAATIKIAKVATDGLRDMLTQRRVRCGLAIRHEFDLPQTATSEPTRGRAGSLTRAEGRCAEWVD